MESRVKLLFAGKVLSDEKTLTDSNVLNNYWIHAIIKDNTRVQNIVRPNRSQVQPNGTQISTILSSIFCALI